MKIKGFVMKSVWEKIFLMFVLLSLCSMFFLIVAKSHTDLLNQDDPVVEVAEATNVTQAQEIIAYNEKYIKAIVREAGHNLPKDMVDMTKRISSIGGAKGQTKTLVKICYEDGSLSEFWVDNN